LAAPTPTGGAVTPNWSVAIPDGSVYSGEEWLMGVTAVFSGAGISGEAPASLPRGFGLRDDVLRVSSRRCEAGGAVGGDR
jgi:hypothetical protein